MVPVDAAPAIVGASSVAAPSPAAAMVRVTRRIEGLVSFTRASGGLDDVHTATLKR
jgi:hypothetical protein